MAQYTPGPWGRNIKPVSKYPIIYAGRNTHIARMYTPDIADISEEEAEANTDLVAAAPRMAETLQRAAHVLAELAERMTLHDVDAKMMLDRLRIDIVDMIIEATPGYLSDGHTSRLFDT